MATKGKKVRVKWDPETERKLIDIWADILEEFDGHMLTRKKKEEKAAAKLNRFIEEELNRPERYTAKEVCHKIDTIMKKGKSMYTNYQKKGETGKPYDDDDADMDIKTAEIAWPNFKTFHDRFQNHPALGPGSVDDSTVTPVAIEEVEVGNDEDTPGSSRCPSRLSESTTVDLEEDEDDEGLPAKKSKTDNETPLARVGKRKGKTGNGSSKEFLITFAELQETIQVRQQEHESRLQKETLEFQQKLEEDRRKAEQDRMKFEAKLATDLQQQSSLFQSNLMQQNQLFHAELFKKLFEKKD
jgi:hypothetical protein